MTESRCWIKKEKRISFSIIKYAQSSEFNIFSLQLGLSNYAKCSQLQKQESLSYSVLEVAREFSFLALLTVLLLGVAINPEFPNFAIAQQYYTTQQVGKPVDLMASAKLIGWQLLNEESEGDQTDQPFFFFFFFFSHFTLRKFPYLIQSNLSYNKDSKSLSVLLFRYLLRITRLFSFSNH